MINILMSFRLRLFRCKIFYIVKCFQMQMISRKIIFFQYLFAFYENGPKNILHCVFGAM